MPRVDQVYAAEERAFLTRQFSGPRFLYVSSSIRIHVRNDVPGRECPCCGSTDAWGIGDEPDLDVLIDLYRGSRRNAWSIQTPDGRKQFEAFAAMARPYGTPGADVAHVPIVYRCTEDRIAELRDDSTESIYWSGGWRSGKTFMLDQWWSRGWLKFGGKNLLFWLVGPELRHAYKMMQKLFVGRPGADGGRSTPSILPTWTDDEGNTVPILAKSMPTGVGQRDLSFSMVDSSKIELHHTKTLGQLEGDDVQRIAMDEVSRMRQAGAYDICRGRVTQCGGQVGLASVPDDDGMWVYEKIVSPFETGTGKHKRVYYYSTHDNVWLAPELATRLEEGESDPVVIEQKIRGRWARHGLFQYAEAYDDVRHTRHTLEHTAAAWGVGPDITAAVVASKFGKRGEYVGGRDFNESPQTGLMAKIFGDIADESTWHLAILDEFVLQRADARAAAAQNSKASDGVYRGALLFCDRNGFWDGHRYGGRPSKTSDAFEFEEWGFSVLPPLYTPRKAGGGGHEPQNPGVVESRRLVAQLLQEGRLLISAHCNRLRKAIPRVPYGSKPSKAANTALDRQVYNLDDSLRYLAWPIFGKAMVPGRKRGRSQIRSGSAVLSGR